MIMCDTRQGKNFSSSCGEALVLGAQPVKNTAVSEYLQLRVCDGPYISQNKTLCGNTKNGAER
jgi:hypothetical protein